MLLEQLPLSLLVGELENRALLQTVAMMASRASPLLQCHLALPRGVSGISESLGEPGLQIQIWR